MKSKFKIVLGCSLLLMTGCSKTISGNGSYVQNSLEKGVTTQIADDSAYHIGYVNISEENEKIAVNGDVICVYDVTSDENKPFFALINTTGGYDFSSDELVYMEDGKGKLAIPDGENINYYSYRNKYIPCESADDDSITAEVLHNVVNGPDDVDGIPIESIVGHTEINFTSKNQETGILVYNLKSTTDNSYYPNCVTGIIDGQGMSSFDKEYENYDVEILGVAWSTDTIDENNLSLVEPFQSNLHIKPGWIDEYSAFKYEGTQTYVYDGENGFILWSAMATSDGLLDLIGERVPGTGISELIDREFGIDLAETIVETQVIEGVAEDYKQPTFDINFAGYITFEQSKS